MNNKIKGLAIFSLCAFGTIVFSVYIDGASGGLTDFFSIPSFVFVIGVGGGLTYMRKHTLTNEGLGKALRYDLTLAGWLGFVVGIILMAAGFESIVDMPAPGIATAAVTILYGYFIGAIAEAFVSK